jgi:hypothetical protein
MKNSYNRGKREEKKGTGKGHRMKKKAQKG